MSDVSRRQFTKQSLGLMAGIAGMSFIGNNKVKAFSLNILPPFPPCMKQDPRLDKIFLDLDDLVSDGVTRRGEKLISLTPSSEMSMTFYSLYINKDKNLRSSSGVGIPTFLNPEDEQYVLTRFRMKYPQVDVYTAIRPYLYLNCHTTNIAYEISKSPLYDPNKVGNVVVIPSDSIGEYGYTVGIPRKLLGVPKAEGFAILDNIQSLANNHNQGWMHVFM